MTMRSLASGVIVMVLLTISCLPGSGSDGGGGPTPASDGTEAERKQVPQPRELDGEASADTPLASESSRSYNLRQGADLFAYYCAPCHGATGEGDGFNAFNLDPRPGSLTDPEFQRERTDEELEIVVAGGGAMAGLSRDMPPWGKTLNERQISNLIRFVRSMRNPTAPPPDDPG